MEKGNLDTLNSVQKVRTITKFIYPEKIMTQHVEKKTVPRCIFILGDELMQVMIQANCMIKTESFAEFLLNFGIIENEKKLIGFIKPKLD